MLIDVFRRCDKGEHYNNSMQVWSRYAQSWLEAPITWLAMASAHQSSVLQALLAGAVGQKLGQCVGQLYICSVGDMHKNVFETYNI